jgi:hypothetical protein
MCYLIGEKGDLVKVKDYLYREVPNSVFVI